MKKAKDKIKKLIVMKLYTSRARVSAQFPGLPGERKEFFGAKNIQL